MFHQRNTAKKVSAYTKFNFSQNLEYLTIFQITFFSCSLLINQEVKLDFKAKLLLKGRFPFKADSRRSQMAVCPSLGQLLQHIVGGLPPPGISCSKVGPQVTHAMSKEKGKRNHTCFRRKPYMRGAAEEAHVRNIPVETRAPNSSWSRHWHPVLPPAAWSIREWISLSFCYQRGHSFM